MDILETIFYTLVTLGILVTIHEYGHFIIARTCGVKVERFSIGFGTPLVRWRDKLDTEFVIAALPLGGYVKMVDARDSNISEEDLPYEFGRQSVWKRIAIVSAGPIANMLLAVVAFWIIFLGGELGVKPVVGEVIDDSQAHQAGFESGMTIVSINDKNTPSWSIVSKELFMSIGVTGELLFAVQLPDSGEIRQINIPIDKWLRDEIEPTPLYALGLSPSYILEELNLAGIIEGSAADKAGLRVDDQILRVNNVDIDDVKTFISIIESNPNRTVAVDIRRQGIDQRIELIPEKILRVGQEFGQIGVQLAPKGKYPDSMVYAIDYTIFGAVIRSVSETKDYTVFIVKSLAKLLVGELSPKNLSGPIAIAQATGESARAGLDNFIRFVAILSIMLGVMNLLPIPVLDGGHLVYYMIEIFKGSPVSEEIQIAGYKIGFAMLLGLMVMATINDLTRVLM